MSEQKAINFMNDEFNSLMEETTEYRCYSLGYAYGLYYIYRYIKSEKGIEEAREPFEGIISSGNKYGEYLQKLIELDLEYDTKAEKLFNKLKNII